MDNLSQEARPQENDSMDDAPGHQGEAFSQMLEHSLEDLYSTGYPTLLNFSDDVATIHRVQPQHTRFYDEEVEDDLTDAYELLFSLVLHKPLTHLFSSLRFFAEQSPESLPGYDTGVVVQNKVLTYERLRAVQDCGSHTITLKNYSPRYYVARFHLVNSEYNEEWLHIEAASTLLSIMSERASRSVWLYVFDQVSRQASLIQDNLSLFSETLSAGGSHLPRLLKAFETLSKISYFLAEKVHRTSAPSAPGTFWGVDTVETTVEYPLTNQEDVLKEVKIRYAHNEGTLFVMNMVELTSGYSPELSKIVKERIHKKLATGWVPSLNKLLSVANHPSGNYSPYVEGGNCFVFVKDIPPELDLILKSDYMEFSYRDSDESSESESAVDSASQTTHSTNP